MEIFTRVTGLMVKLMEMVFSLIRPTKLSMKVNGNKTSNMVKELKHGTMEIANIKVILLRVRRLVRPGIHKVEMSMMENLLMASSMEQANIISSKQVRLMRVISKTIK